MKTIVLFFLFVALAGVTASHSKRHKAQESGDAAEEPHDWPQPESMGEFGVPPEYGGPPPSDGDQPPENNDGPSGKSRVRSNRRHQN